MPGVGDIASTFGVLAAGHLTVQGRTLALTKTRAIASGHVAIQGKSLTWLSSGWQYITITSIASIGVVRTLYDSLDPLYSLTPSIGDVWRVPVFSQDGGSVTVSVDGRFEIGAPTSGFDLLAAVMYFNIITGLWYGPADMTILNPPLMLSISPGHLTNQGKSLSANVRRVLGSGRLIVFGHQMALRRLYVLNPGHLTASGKPLLLNHQLSIQPGRITVAGKVLALAARLTLSIVPGHVTTAGKQFSLDRALAIEPGHLTIGGSGVELFTGLPLFVEPGHLSVLGQVLRFDKRLLVTPGHLSVSGRNLLIKSTGAIGLIDKPIINSGRRRRQIRTSQD